jgi:hypothetical protein
VLVEGPKKSHMGAKLHAATSRVNVFGRLLQGDLLCHTSEPLRSRWWPHNILSTSAVVDRNMQFLKTRTTCSDAAGVFMLFPASSVPGHRMQFSLSRTSTLRRWCNGLSETGSCLGPIYYPTGCWCPSSACASYARISIQFLLVRDG